MKNIFKNKIALLTGLFVLMLASCYTPSPLYGTWSDNDGNTINFINDGTFVAKVKDTTNNLVTYQGDYSVIDNVLVFQISNPYSATVTTEWDVRGSMLYLIWKDSSLVDNELTLYHTAR